MGGELIEDEHPGTGQERAGQCQALALAPGQGLASLTHEGVVTVLEGLDVLVDAGRSARPAHLGVRGRGRRQAHVVRNGGPHEVNPLIHQADLLVEADGTQIAHILAVDEDAARVRLIEAHHQLGQCGLARSGGPHDAGPSSGPGPDADAADGLSGGVGVGVGDVLPQDLVGDTGGQLLIAVAHLHGGVDDLPHSLSRGEGGIERARELLDPADGLRQPQHRSGRGRQEGDVRARAGRRQCRTRGNDGDRRAQTRQLVDASPHGGPLPGWPRGTGDLGVDPGHLIETLLAAPVPDNFTHALNGVGHVLGKVRPRRRDRAGGIH